MRCMVKRFIVHKDNQLIFKEEILICQYRKIVQRKNKEFINLELITINIIKLYRYKKQIIIINKKYIIHNKLMSIDIKEVLK